MSSTNNQQTIEQKELSKYVEVSRLLEKGVWTEQIYNEVFPNVVERTASAYGKQYNVLRWSVLIADCEESAIIKDRKVVKWEVTKDGEKVRLDSKSKAANYGQINSLANLYDLEGYLKVFDFQISFVR